MNIMQPHFKEKTIEDLPDEILEYILSLVSPYKDLESCKVVSKRWCRAIKSVSQHSKCDLHRCVINSSVIWQCIIPTNLSPTITQRYSHAACYSDSSMYVFGGCTSTCTTFNDLWTLNLTRRQWIRPSTTGNYPSPKACATLCCYNKTLILFGGWTHPPPYPLHQTLRLFNELHSYDTTCNRWSAIHTTTTPPPMAGHSVSIHRNIMVVFGGLQKTNILGLYSSSNDVWCFDLENQCWSSPVISDPKPEPRYGQSQIFVDENNILIFGGCGGPNTVLDDVWLLTMNTPVWTWKQIKIYNSQWAAPHMWCHPACRVGDAVVVFSRASPQALSHYSACSTVRPILLTQEALIPPEVVARQASQVSPSTSKDMNVNGQHGVLGRFSRTVNAPSTSMSAPCEDGSLSSTPSDSGCSRDFINREPRLNVDIQMAAFRDGVTCPKHGSSKNRLKQLESLKRMEARYKNPPKEDHSKSRKVEETTEPAPNPGGGSAANRMNMYVADISEAISLDASVTWKPPRSNTTAPRDTMLHSVVLGKGELIVFGGIQKDPSVMTFSMSSYKSVSNHLYFVTAPRSIV